jgi:hypothetical protein
VTTGTGSGKSLSFFIPVIDRILKAKAAVGSLLGEFGQCDSRGGHRGFLGQVAWVAPQPYPGHSRWPPFAGRPASKSYTTSWDIARPCEWAPAVWPTTSEVRRWACEVLAHTKLV